MHKLVLTSKTMKSQGNFTIIINYAISRVSINFYNLNIIDAPELTGGTATSTTIGLSWTKSGSSVDSYTVSYTYTIRRCGSGPMSGSVEISDGNVRSFTLTDLEEDSDYTITLTAISAAGQLTSNQISTTTDTAGIATDNDSISSDLETI